MNTQKFLPQCSVYSSAYESSWDVRENLQGRIFQCQRSDQATYVIYFLGQIGGKHLARGKSQMTISQFFFTRELASLKKIIVTLNHHSFQFSSVDQSCPTLCDPMNHSTPGLSVHHQLLEFTQTHVHRVGDSIQPSHPLSSPSPPALNLSQNQGLFQ